MKLNHRILKFLVCTILMLTQYACKAQKDKSQLKFTSDLETFKSISSLKTVLSDVEIIALGENTHGLGKVFKTKVDLVKYLHRELGFDLLLFETGFGDAALAWEQKDALSTEAFTTSFTSYGYYHSEEIKALVDYVKSSDKPLMIQGFDCQPQQEYLAKRMAEIIKPIDSMVSKSVASELWSFNKLYQLEYDKDSTNFYKQRQRFIDFLDHYNSILDNHRQPILNSGTTNEELQAIKKSIGIFKDTYANIKMGDMMGWPSAANIRDKSMYETVKWYKEKYPNKKIIIWAQNSHIENSPRPNVNAVWMGHYLKKEYGDKYYSIGAIVYKGRSLKRNLSDIYTFEHNNTDYLAYHLNKLQKGPFLINLRTYKKNDFITQQLRGMENNGNITEFIAKGRFDGILFLEYSDVPKLLKEE